MSILTNDINLQSIEISLDVPKNDTVPGMALDDSVPVNKEYRPLETPSTPHRLAQALRRRSYTEQLARAMYKPRRPRCVLMRSCCSLLLWFGTALAIGAFLPEYVDIRSMHTTAKGMYRQHILGIPQPVAPLVGDGDISAQEIESILWHQFGKVDVFVTDMSYKMVDTLEMADFLDSDDTDKRTYFPSRNDCDDYAQILLGNVRQHEYDIQHNHSWAFGMAFGPMKTDETALHAFNILIDSSKQVSLVEPQSDVVYSPQEYKYTVRSVFF